MFMKNKKLIILIFLIMLFSTFFNPVSLGQRDEMFKNNKSNQYFNYNIYNLSEKIMNKNNIKNEYRINQVNLVDNVESLELNENYTGIISSSDGPPMDSPWPMYCHDVRHTGRSPYSTADNSFYNKWWFKCYDYIEGSGAIDKDGVIYFGGEDDNYDRFLFAVYPNGTLKWKCFIDGEVGSSPVIDEDGTIYVGIEFPWDGLIAINPNGTIKWRNVCGRVLSSTAIGSDGTIFFGVQSNSNPPLGAVIALYPNGSLKWRYNTNHVVYSSPAIGDDGTVYCGCHDNYLYAFYPDNGTLKWKYQTGHWVRASPCIGDDSTIYVVSLDNYLHAVNPDGTLKWATYVGAGTSPTIGQDGTIYAGYSTLYAVNPADGSVKWTFPVGDTMRGGTPCNSADGTIIFGTDNEPYGGDIVAVNPDGTLRWRKQICDYGWGVEFAPIIGEDSTVYIGTSAKEYVYPGAVRNYGYLYAFNNMDPVVPTAPEINGPNKGKIGIEYQYTFKATSPLCRDLYYYIEWGDGDWTTQWWIGPYNSSETIKLNHTWLNKDKYTIKVRCKDTENLWGPWSEYSVIITPRNRVSYSSLFMRFLERFPLLQKLLNFR
jgi:outer membrane protein assembly factor BamB